MILAIDLGSTAFKAALFDRNVREARFGSRSVSYRYQSGGRVELPVAALNATLSELLADVLAGSHEGLDAVAITGQAQTFTLLDNAGSAVMPFISWRDTRSEASAAAVRLQRELPDFADHAGFGAILSALQIAQLAALSPDAALRPVQLSAYLGWLLCGSLVIDSNQAAMTGLYSCRTGRWWPAALNACGLREKQLPRLVPVGAVAGETARGALRFGLPTGIPVVLAGNDQTAGAVAAELQRGGVLLTLGTALAAYAWLAETPPPAPRRIRGPYPGGGSYAMTTDSAGGALINWAQGILTGCSTDDTFFAAAAQAPPGANELIFALSDTGGGDWRGAGPAHGVADFARALLECLSVRAAACVTDLDLHPLPDVIRAGGGGGKRRLWLDIISALIQTPLRATRAAPLLGAARMAVASLRA